ncbi:MAG: ribonuclease HI family protein [Minisyncoccia bacterium]
MKITMYTDGGARGNPGPAGAGAALFDEKGNVLREISDYLGETTNNVAEYEALIRALEAVKKITGSDFSQTEIAVHMDSELVVRQIEGRYKVKAPELRPRFVRAQELIGAANKVLFTHVPREKNKHADRLVNEAIDRGLKGGRSKKNL